ncbi:TlpA disulfide reductase family protein [Plebeiibacterium sediminum]|uniref:AhpC/TSA family protein n=1 Tax=Plebeiibacterium sediminum TaxID=2992112 RepID=A0AAE3M8T5_9BACT|nr:TlpA disulfide reductase family protein [Plebeiobacterium sediminum]MCW3789188.1 AhpC/TSA family protein [Plebeiobacterium sediminum]
MKQLLLVALLAISFVACQQKQYTIEGTIEGVEDGQAVLSKIENGRPVSIDTTQIVQGKFTFTGSEEVPQVYLVFIDDMKTPIMLFGENGNINITVADKDKIADAEVTGSTTNDVFNTFVKELPGRETLDELQADFQKAMMSNDKDTMEALKAEANAIMEKQKAYFVQFVKDNTSSVVAAYLANQTASYMEFEEFKEVVGQLEANLGDHMYVTSLKESLANVEKAENAKKATEIGAVAPEFTLESIDGASISLSSLQGKYLLVDFWASWCKPCRAENPNVVKAYNTFGSKGFDVLSVSLDRDSAAWKKAVSDDGLVWNHVIDAKGDIAQTYGVQGIPFTLLLDKDGKIIAKNLRGAALEEKLAELLN